MASVLECGRRQGPRLLFRVLLGLLLAIVLAGLAPAAALAAEAGGGSASDGGGFDLSTPIEIIGAIVIPSLTFGAGVVAWRVKQGREERKEQLAAADEFLAQSGKLLDRLRTFATGSDRADDVALLLDELKGLAEASTKIADSELKQLGQRFFDSAGAVLRAVASPDKSTQPAAQEAVRAFDDLRAGVERFRREGDRKRRRSAAAQGEGEVSIATPPPVAERETPSPPSGEMPL
ncbi:MAG: hypothetical protein AB7V58_03555 [Solirubrobacterales bacterium]